MSDTLPTAQVIARIRKLLALSRSSNPHEASLAAEKAQEIMFAHSLSMAEVEASTGAGAGWTSDEVKLGTMGSISWKRRLFTGVAGACFCQGLWYSSEAVGIVVGRPHNVKLVTHLYQYLHRTIDRLADADWRRMGSERWHATTWKLHFCAGAADMVTARLYRKRRSLEDADPRSRALVPVEDAGLKEQIEKRFPNRREVKDETPETLAYGFGVRAGGRIPLDDALSAGPPAQQLAMEV